MLGSLAMEFLWETAPGGSHRAWGDIGVTQTPLGTPKSWNGSAGRALKAHPGMGQPQDAPIPNVQPGLGVKLFLFTLLSAVFLLFLCSGPDPGNK